ncbi:M43 family zinc metalloprotease [Marinigracilibium pacificum]|uniref:T9SS type B sorting domain-containing protein n=1 Tax=Marinigracilibium pacificum TaxID=2729599 RepID=A0A848J3M0_9BACT|nr:M43 family zinc metalloprotease [Marinigracilibium pacificum]NMM47772.1 T9SS type B sorting domain-containing protein [Marinigracilibium pacificum]
MNLRSILYCFLILIISGELKSQVSMNSCSPIELTRREREKIANDFKLWKQSNAIQRNQDVVYTIPVVVHLIENDPIRTDEQIEKLINELNYGFANSGNFYTENGVDTNIRFCLAKTAPDGSNTNGITRRRSRYSRFDYDLESSKLKTIQQWDPRHYLNIWIVNEIYSEALRFYSGRTWWKRYPLAGFATVPQQEISLSDYSDGVVVDIIDGPVLIHEVGHYLGLLHTFDGGCTNNNCLVDGDMVCDTPPDNSVLGDCEENSCSTDTLSNFSNGNFYQDVPDMTSNFMDYSSCGTDFTAGQSERMHFVLENYRTSLFMESDGNPITCNRPCDSFEYVRFDHDPWMPLSGDSVEFTSLGDDFSNLEWYVEFLGDDEPTYSTAMELGYTPEGLPLSTDSIFSYKFDQVGKYRVYLKAWNDEETCFSSHSAIIRAICQVDARFWPNIRYIASKLPISRFTEPVTFNNNSLGAIKGFEWTVKHTSINGEPNLPVFKTDITSILIYLFEEPGNYQISLKAFGESCVDELGPFVLPVVDPTIDGIPVIEEIKCLDTDSMEVQLKVYNEGYDTVNIGTPVSFYTGNPTKDADAKLIQTLELPDIVYGFDSATFNLKITRNINSDELHVVFNDTGEGSIPLIFPPPDENVYSFNTVYPPSGYAELLYENNFDFKEVNLELLDLLEPDVYACLDEEIMLSVNLDNIDTLRWDSFLKGYIGHQNPESYIVEGLDTVFVTVVDENGCKFLDSMNVIPSIPEVNVDERYIQISRGERRQLRATGALTYMWEPPTWLSNPNVASPITSPDESILYTVTGKDSIGCADTAQVMVFILTSAHIPELFSPNGDGQNERLKIFDLEGIKDFQFTIYNRTGSIVYETNNPSYITSAGWDGSWKGKEQPSGIYFWRVSGSYINNDPILLNGKETGTIHLIR